MNLEEIDVHSHRAWALTSMLMTNINQGADQPSNEVITEALPEIWERSDAIGAQIHKGAQS